MIGLSLRSDRVISLKFLNLCILAVANLVGCLFDGLVLLLVISEVVFIRSFGNLPNLSVVLRVRTTSLLLFHRQWHF